MSFPFRLPNFPHQQEEFDRWRDHDARALLWTMRTGKTKSIIDTVCYRHVDRRDVDGLLIIAPNGVHCNWLRRQLPVHMWGIVDWKAHAWQSSEAHKPSHAAGLESVMNYRQGLAILAINSEVLVQDHIKALIKRFLRGRRIFLVGDESHDFRSPGSKRTKTMRGLAKRCPVRRILSGTAVDNSPLAAYSQFEIVEPGALGFTRFAEFERRYAIFVEKQTADGRKYPVLDTYCNLDELQGRIARWSSVVTRADVRGMPDLLMEERTIAMPDKLMDLYRKMVKEYIIELEDGAEVDAVGGGARLTKLQQILGGFVVGNDGQVHELVTDEENPRLQALLAEVRGAGGKVIIWCKYQEDIRRVVRVLRKEGRRVVEYHGRIHSQVRRQEAIDAFMNDPTVTDFVGQPAAGGEGLDLSAAEAILWYSHTFDLIERNQANERATQIHGRGIAVVDFVVPGTVDAYILQTLERKRSISDELAGTGLRDRLLQLFRSML